MGHPLRDLFDTGVSEVDQRATLLAVFEALISVGAVKEYVLGSSARGLVVVLVRDESWDFEGATAAECFAWLGTLAFESRWADLLFKALEKARQP